MSNTEHNDGGRTMQTETIKGDDCAAIITTDKYGRFEVAFGYIDSDGFNCLKESRQYKTETGARRAAVKWANR